MQLCILFEVAYEFLEVRNLDITGSYSCIQLLGTRHLDSTNIFANILVQSSQLPTLIPKAIGHYPSGKTRNKS